MVTHIHICGTGTPTSPDASAMMCAPADPGSLGGKVS